MNNNLGAMLKDIQLPPVTVKVDDDTWKNFFVTGILLSAAIMVMWVLIFGNKNS